MIFDPAVKIVIFRIDYSNVIVIFHDLKSLIKF